MIQVNKKTFLEVCIYFNDCQYLSSFCNLVQRLPIFLIYSLTQLLIVEVNRILLHMINLPMAGVSIAAVKRVELLKIFVCLKETLRNSFILGSDQK